MALSSCSICPALATDTGSVSRIRRAIEAFGHYPKAFSAPESSANLAVTWISGVF